MFHGNKMLTVPIKSPFGKGGVRAPETQTDYERCRYSITCQTDDLAVVHCLRALCQHCEQDCVPQIAWGGTGEEAWRDAGNQITLRFTNPEYRAAFVREVTRLLPAEIWREVGQIDNDPAKRQRQGA
jgi:hypothetical protein